MFNDEIKLYNLPQEEQDTLKVAIFETSKGTIRIPLFNTEAVNTVANFAHLANTGFYDGLNFHRVIAGFMAQGGCPDGRGTGGPGWAIPCETKKCRHRHLTGTLSMAHRGPDTGGSQFFITFAPQPHLDGVHTVFGQIDPTDSESLEVLKNIRQGDTINSIRVGE